ncbi:hypothetical protein HYW87_04720 [Candidatus Roizmanbacteria bacterium]|nr:hypothetical protein [Candidatus Roizmanbacteria bacterium]
MKNFNGVIIEESLENKDVLQKVKIIKTKVEEVTKYGVSLGIPDYQLDFSPHIKEWER